MQAGEPAGFRKTGIKGMGLNHQRQDERRRGCKNFPGLRFNEFAVALAVLALGRQITEIGNAAGAISQQRAAQIKIPMVQPFAIFGNGAAEGVGRGGMDAVVNARVGGAMGGTKNRGVKARRRA